MMRLVLVIVAAACVEPGEEGPANPSDNPADPLPSDPTLPPPTETDEPPPPVGDCGPQDGLEVLSLEAIGWHPDTMVELEVTLSSPATVAGACVADDEPDQIFFAESTDQAEVHTLRLSGLLANKSYTCAAAPTCPTQLAPAAVTTYQTSAPPSDLRQFTVVVDPVLGMTGAWTLAPYAETDFASDTWIAIWGPDGRVRWWTELPQGPGIWIEARYHTEDDTIVWGGGFDPQGRIRVLDMWDGELYAWAPDGWQDTVFHHDGKRIADGRLMTLEIRENSVGNNDWDGFGIRVHDPDTGVVDFEFNSQKLVDEGILEEGGGGFGGNDPYHANWMEWHESAAGPQVYVSLCFSEQILAIDATTGELDWLLGEGMGWTVLDAAGDVISPNALPDCQHGIEVIGDNHLLVYDNGQFQPNSAAEEWIIDPDAMTAQLIWSWTEPGWSEWYLGDIDDLGNDRVLLTEAPGPVVEVDRATGQVASRMTFNNGGSTYRAERYDGCDFFTSVKECEDLAVRYAEVEALLE